MPDSISAAVAGDSLAGSPQKTTAGVGDSAYVVVPSSINGSGSGVPTNALNGTSNGLRHDGTPDESWHLSWQKDRVVVAVSNAFLLGWRITELKSRVRIAADLTSAIQQARQSGSSATDQQRLTQTPQSAAPQSAAPQSVATPTMPGGTRQDRLVSVDLAVSNLGDPVWLASMWRATFEQIALIHYAQFPDSTTAGSLYEPPNGRWEDALPYLYKGTKTEQVNPSGPAYAHIGLAPQPANPGSVDGAPILPSFTLYETTRRALNCLILLYAHCDDSLIGDTLHFYQLDLLGALGCLGRAIPEPIAALCRAIQQSTSNELTNGDGSPPIEEIAARFPPDALEAARVAAIQMLTTTVTQLLDSWAGYLRENYYAGGTFPHDSRERVGYEAGRSLAELAWNVSTGLVVKECQNVAPIQDAAQRLEIEKEFYEQWRKTFSTSHVIEAQHYITALSATFDDAYYRVTGRNSLQPTASSPVQDGLRDGPAQFDPDLPSQAFDAVKHNLDYWLRAILWLNPDATDQAADPIDTAAQSGQREGADHLRFSTELSRRLRLALIEQSGLWLSLLSGSQRLSMFTVESVMHRMVQEVMDEFYQAASKSLTTPFSQELKNAARRFGPLILLVLAVAGILSVPALIWLRIAQPHVGTLNANGLWAVLGIGPAIAGIFGVRALGSTSRGTQGSAAPGTAPANSMAGVTSGGTTRPADASSGGGALIEQVGSMLGAVSATLLVMLRTAYAQVRLDLSAFNHYVGVSYPLIECFIYADSQEGHSAHGAQTQGVANRISSAYDFMTQVIWNATDRQDEIEGIVRAALGPLGIVMGMHVATANAGVSSPIGPLQPFSPSQQAATAAATVVVADRKR